MPLRFLRSLLSASLCSKYLEWLSTVKPRHQHIASKHYHVMFKTTTILHSEVYYMAVPKFKSTTVCHSSSSFEACVRRKYWRPHTIIVFVFLSILEPSQRRLAKMSLSASSCLSFGLSIELYAHDSKTAHQSFREFDVRDLHFCSHLKDYSVNIHLDIKYSNR
jgi:hypothetical protein